MDTFLQIKKKQLEVAFEPGVWQRLVVGDNIAPHRFYSTLRPTTKITISSPIVSSTFSKMQPHSVVPPKTNSQQQRGQTMKTRSNAPQRKLKINV